VSRCRRVTTPSGTTTRSQAVIECKKFENLLHDLGQIQILHQQLAELATYPHAALVVEARYGDFLDPERVRPWSAAHVARVLAEIAAVHPALPVIYAGNRKLANEWAHGLFRAVAARLADAAPDTVAETEGQYRPTPATGGLRLNARREILHELPATFTMRMLHERFPTATPTHLRTVLHTLRDEGRLRREGHGRGARWVRITADVSSGDS